ncbi:MAG: RelA/SpoT domain-containing protein [Thermomicrobiales bacterium]
MEAPDTHAIDELVRQYQAELPGLQIFRGQLEALLVSLLSAFEIPYSHVESRCKGVAEFREKITRKGYTHPASEMTDRIGLRAIMFYDGDVEAVVRIIRQEFTVDEVNSIDRRTPAAVESFGYRSFHLVLALDERRAALPEWAAFAGVPVELQVRTVLAHAWAAVGHQVAYKQPPLPPDKQRLLAQISAMLETTDILFDTLRFTPTGRDGAISKIGPDRGAPVQAHDAGDEERTS